MEIIIGSLIIAVAIICSALIIRDELTDIVVGIQCIYLNGDPDDDDPKREDIPEGEPETLGVQADRHWGVGDRLKSSNVLPFRKRA